MALAWLLAKATNADPTLPKINEPESSDLEPVQKQADALARRGPEWKADPASLMSILRALSETDKEFTVKDG